MFLKKMLQYQQRKDSKDYGSLIKSNISSVVVLFKIFFCDIDDGMFIKWVGSNTTTKSLENRKTMQNCHKILQKLSPKKENRFIFIKQGGEFSTLKSIWGENCS